VTRRLRARIREARRAPLAVAALLAVPLFFSSLMAVSLAIERPRVVEWQGPRGIKAIYHPPTHETEVRIWLLALGPPLALLLVGAATALARRGVVLPAVAGVAVALAVTARLGTWERHHTQRFPRGVDNLGESSNSNTLSAGQWEATAAEAARQLRTATILVALGVLAATVIGWLRARRRAAAAATRIPVGVHAPTATPPDVG
jgi:hypothetical protein